MHAGAVLPRRRTALAALAGWAVGDAGAQQVWPTRAVQIVVPSSRGAAIGDAAVILAAAFGKRWQQRVQLQNAPGDGTVSATLAVARAPADGYHLGLSTSALAINAALRTRLPYSTLADLAPVALLASFQYGIYAHRSLPVTTAAGLVAYAQAARAPVPYASPGVGTGAHVALEAFAFEAGIRVAHKPFVSAAQAERAVLAGEPSLLVMAVPSTIAAAMAGPLRLVALMGHKEQAALKGLSWASDVVSGFEITGQIGAIAPRAVPKALLQQIGQELAAAVRLPEVRAALAEIGMEASGIASVDAEAYLRADIARWRLVGRVAGIRLD